MVASSLTTVTGQTGVVFSVLVRTGVLVQQGIRIQVDAMAGGMAQTALSEDDANHMLKLLNAQARRGDSSMRK